MAIHKDMVVDIPEHAYIQRRGGKAYVYVYTEFFRKADGKPSNKSKAMGMLCDGDERLMHPNDNYLKAYRIPAERKESSTLSVGYSAVVEQCCRDLGLDAALEAAFGGELAPRIKVLAAYVGMEGSELDYIDDFCEKHHFKGFDDIITPEEASEIACSVTSDAMHAFFGEWIPRASGGDGYVCLDVTDVLAWSRMADEGRYGYDRDDERIPKTRLSLFCSEETHLPVYLYEHEGPVSDCERVLRACANARAAGLKGPLKLVADGGFFQESKLAALVADGITVTCGMPAYLDVTKSYIDAHMGEVTRPENYVGRNDVDCDSTFALMVEGQELFGIPCRVLVGFSTEAMWLQSDDLDAKLARYETQEIPAIKEYATVTSKRRYTDLFDFEEQDGGGFTFRRNEAKVGEARRRFGYFAILTTDELATAREIIDTYRDKDRAAKHTERRQYAGEWPSLVRSQAFEGKYGIPLISMIIQRWLREKLGAYMEAHHMPLKRCLMRLTDICMYVADDEVRLERAISEGQRELLHLCGVDAGRLEQSARASIVASEGR